MSSPSGVRPRAAGIRRRLLGPYSWLQAFGFDPRQLARALRVLPQVTREYATLRRQNKVTGAGWKLNFSRPSLHDRHEQSGATRGHYFIQDLLIAQRIFERNPARHVDAGSRIVGFVAHVASFRKIEVLDIRPLETKIPNVSFRQCDLMGGSAGLDDYADSVSCLHAIEHMGLGRYGDPLDISGHERALAGLTRILKKRGTLYLSVPIGAERIEFNGHRVFSVTTILELSKPNYILKDFSYIDDGGNLHENVDPGANGVKTNFGLRYGCGIFEFEKV
jgi:hypothetical protein